MAKTTGSSSFYTVLGLHQGDEQKPRGWLRALLKALFCSLPLFSSCQHFLGCRHHHSRICLSLTDIAFSSEFCAPSALLQGHLWLGLGPTRIVQALLLQQILTYIYSCTRKTVIFFSGNGYRFLGSWYDNFVLWLLSLCTNYLPYIKWNNTY